MAFRKVVLHIGSHKTGSSFLQRTLVQIYDSLAQQGWSYPEAGHWRTEVLLKQLDL